MSRPQIRRLTETCRAPVSFLLNGQPVTALEGDTVLTAVLTLHGSLRVNEFSKGPRAGFCLMGACQDCWISTVDGNAIHACSTFIAEGMALVTEGNAG
jgi:D-hydroxyproline dehydrogenase subunit gamma